MALMGKDGEVLTVLETGLERAIEEFKQMFFVPPDDIQSLITTVKRIKAVLKDAEKRQIKEETVRLWLGELKQLFLDAEDLVDEYATDEALRSSIGAESRKKISNINKRLQDLANIKGMFCFQESFAENSQIRNTHNTLPTTSLLADVKSVIGRDREKKMIIDLLLSSTHYQPESSNSSSRGSSSNNRKFSVLPIVGMGGLGKTTLARLVYNDQRVMDHFTVRMWVCVSTDFDPIRLTKDMINSGAASDSFDSIQQKLKDKVEGKTFLLVLDDVWGANLTQWESLFAPLSYANRGSKILVTTRNSKAVDRVGEGLMCPIPLKGLSDDDFWLLFKRWAFAGSSTHYLLLEEVGRRVAKRLGGLPLAAKAIGSLLHERMDISHWRNVEKSEIWNLPQDEDGILPALELSYQHLTGNLKQCFAYCSLFPKDHLFGKADLTQLWDAEGFSGTRSMVMKDNSSEYFDILLHRSFFEYSPQVKDRFVMHDLMHDLAESVSKDDCLRLSNENTMKFAPTSTVRHISLFVRKFDQVKLIELCRQEKLRTLLFSRGCQFDEPFHALNELFSKLKRLRVLCLSCCEITELPDSIGDLKHLRYIDISDNPLKNLPESLGNLYNLQVLKLSECRRLTALPPTMSELINLRHLQAGYQLISRIDGLGKLTALQELYVKGGKLRDLRGMCMLRKLEIWNMKVVCTKEEAIQAQLLSKLHLRELKVRWNKYDNDYSRNCEMEEEILQALRPIDSIRRLGIHGYGGAKSPDWMKDLTTWASFGLEHVKLEYCPNWEVLPSFGQLHLLKSLKIIGMPRVRLLNITFFKSLEELHIKDLPEWEDCGHRPDHCQENLSSPTIFFFPRLHKLEINKCPKLRELPPLPPTLTRLVLENVGLTCLPAVLQPMPSPASSILSSAFALSEITIDGCKHMTSVSGLQGHDLSSPTLFCFPRLRELEIRNYPKLKELTPLPPTLRRLTLKNVGLTCLRAEVLQPMPSLASSILSSAFALSELTIDECNHLEYLSIQSCKELVSLPERGFGHLVSLRRLEIWWCPKLTCQPHTWEEEEDDDASSSSSQHLPTSLQQLDIWDCGDAMGGWWWAGLQNLTSLYELSLHGCPSTLASLFDWLDVTHQHHHLAKTLKQLSIFHCGYNHYCQQQPVPWGFLALTSLTKLVIDHSPGVMCRWGTYGLPLSVESLSISGDDDLDDECLARCLLQHNLNSLVRLSIYHCPVITCLPARPVLEDHSNQTPPSHPQTEMAALRILDIAYCEEMASLGSTFLSLPSLEKLVIAGCPKLKLIHHDSPSSSPLKEFVISKTSQQQLQGWLLQSSLIFPCLTRLVISNCPQLTSFDEEEDEGGGKKELEVAWLRLAPSLTSLNIHMCENLRSLPAALSSLSCLQTLRIINCYQIRSLPEMGLPASLQELHIAYCSALVKRYGKEGGPEWHKISHIPRVKIY